MSYFTNSQLTKMHYGFLDESGILEKKAQAGKHFIISTIIIGEPAELQQAMKSARQKARGKFKMHSVFKAHKENPGFVRLVLQELNRRDIKIIIGVWDKKKSSTRLDKNLLYAKLLAQTIKSVLNIYSKLNLVIHKRYVLPRIQNQINQIVSETVKANGKFLYLEQKTEIERKELELADAVAWAMFQKYNNQKPEFYEIIKNKIIKENRLAA